MFVKPFKPIKQHDPFVVIEGFRFGTYSPARIPPLYQHLGSDDCLEVRRENNQNCSVLYCVRQLCTMIRTHTRTVSKFACRLKFSFRILSLYLG